MSKSTDTAMGAGEGALTGLAVAGPIGAGAGAIIGALASWYGASQQATENRRARETQERLFNQQMGWEQTQYAGNMAFNEKQLAATTSMSKAQLRAQQMAQAQNNQLSKKQLALSETGQNANIALGNRSATLAETQNTQQYGLSKEAQAANIDLGKRGMALQEKQVETEAQANKFNQIATLMANMTQFYNSPSARQGLAGLYRGYRR